MIVLNHFTPLPCYELVMHLPCDEVIKQYKHPLTTPMRIKQKPKERLDCHECAPLPHGDRDCHLDRFIEKVVFRNASLIIARISRVSR